MADDLNNKLSKLSVSDEEDSPKNSPHNEESLFTDTSGNKDDSTEGDKERRYVVLQETNGKECESWYYFLRYNGNEEALKYLNDQLEKIDMFIMEDCSTFDLDLDHTFSEQTAKEMIMLEVNVTFHRKFDGDLDMVDLKLKRRDSNEDMIYKVYEKIGMGQIEDFIDQEDIPDDGNLRSDSESVSSGDSDSDGDEPLVPMPTRQSKLLPKKLNNGKGGAVNNKKKNNKKHANRRLVNKKNK